MNLKKSFALQARQRYLNQMLINIDEEYFFYFDWCDGVMDINEHYALLQLDRLCKEKSDTMKELARVKNILKPERSDITDDMIERAKLYPVDKLIDFTRGKAICFNHDDRAPSMYHATRAQRANCPVCDRSFNAIDILMERDGMNFKAAVKQLTT